MFRLPKDSNWHFNDDVCIYLSLLQIAVLISNAVASFLQPSIYDSIIRIKKLPYLPDILSSASEAYDIFVESFMVKNVKYIYYGITYEDLKKTLLGSRKVRSLPLVDSPSEDVTNVLLVVIIRARDKMQNKTYI